MTTKNTPWQFSITLQLQAPFNTAASEPGLWGMDSPLLRDHLGRVCLPGTLVQGRLAEELGNWDASPNGLFDQFVQRIGAEAKKGGTNEPLRKSLVFTDLVLEKTGDQATLAKTPSKHLHRIALDSARGSVQPGHLLMQETPALAGAVLTFKGHAHAFVESDNKAHALANQLQSLLRLVPHFGADGSVGFGQTRSVHVHPASCAPDRTAILPFDTQSVHFALRMNRPLLVTDAPGTANGFEPTEVLAGNVLKGAFADTCQLLGLKVPDCLEHIVFRHAFCTRHTDRPLAIPASLAECEKAGNKVLVDLAEQATPVLLRSGETLQAPAFAPDWKDNALRQQSLDTAYRWSHPQKLLRVRTAIDPATRTAADEQLFAWEMLAHEAPGSKPDDPPTPWLWHTGIDLSSTKIKSEDRKQAITTIQTVLQHGLYFLGKTKAIATVRDVQANPTTGTVPKLETDQTLYLCLQTPALLTKMDSIGPNTNTADHLLQAYRQTFSQQSHSALKLTHFYARQTLRGGAYQHIRFQGQQQYRPWLFTEAGAVFALKVVDAEKARAVLQTWLSQGLPVAEGWGTHWRQNPYLPANGFGEVCLYEPGKSPFAPATQGITCIPLPPLPGAASPGTATASASPANPV